LLFVHHFVPFLNATSSFQKINYWYHVFVFVCGEAICMKLGWTKRWEKLFIVPKSDHTMSEKPINTLSDDEKGWWRWQIPCLNIYCSFARCHRETIFREFVSLTTSSCLLCQIEEGGRKSPACLKYLWCVKSVYGLLGLLLFHELFSLTPHDKQGTEIFFSIFFLFFSSTAGFPT
jgi:hypothetical protein